MAGTKIPDGPPERSGGLKPEGRRPDNPSVPGNIKSGQIPAGQKLVLGAEAKPSNVPLANTMPQNQLFGKTVEKAVIVEKTIEKAIIEVLEAPAPARELFKQTAATLGLPKDNLSLALLVFMRYFSLPLEGTLITRLRREILASGKASSPETSKESSALEAEALAAVIAEDKGVRLSPEALQRYAAYLVPPVFTGHGGREENPHNREELPTPDELLAIAEGEEGQEDGFLDLLNSIPGKNGQFWMVFPFTITIKGTELRVFVRILKREYIFPGEGDQLIADISGPKRQWRCFLKRNGGKYRADIRVFPECSPRSLRLLQKEFERFLSKGSSLLGNLEFQEILVQNGNEIPSWLEDLSVECLPSENKDI